MDQAELEAMLGRGPVLGGVLSYLMSSLDRLASAPFAHLAKGGDPISLHHAVEYITANEMTNTIFILHFVDDRAAVRDVNVREEIYAADPSEVTANSGGSDDTESLLGMFLCSRAAHGEASAASAGARVGASRFELVDALRALPPKSQRLVHTVAILDAFYT